MASNDLFARKFDETVDSGILNILESHISQPSALPVERSRRMDRAVPVGVRV